MPRLYFMSFDGKPYFRWKKMVKGVMHYVSCKELGAKEWTRDGSWQLANEWWRKKQAELDGETPKKDPRIKVLEELIGEEITSQEQLSLVVQAFKEATIESIVTGQPMWTREQAGRAVGEARLKTFEDTVANAIEAFKNPQRVVEGSMADWSAKWHKHQQMQVRAGTLTPARCANNQTCLAHFVAYVAGSSPVERIDAAMLQGFYEHCLGKVSDKREGVEGWSTAYARDVFSVAKSFVRWLWEREAIGLPKNIGSKSFKFGSSAKAIKTWSPSEFIRIVREAPGKLKLGLLLMANCGMTQGDISDLLDDEVDWKEGRIIRQRSKTAGNENVPTVNYKLWPSTFELLRKYRSGQKRVLLTESGLPYVRKELEGGKLVKADGFASNFVHLKKRLGFKGSLKQLRKLGVSLLDSHETYGRFGSLFLGHSARTVKDKHYSQPSQSLFDEAVAWLGSQLGQC